MGKGIRIYIHYYKTRRELETGETIKTKMELLWWKGEGDVHMWLENIFDHISYCSSSLLIKFSLVKRAAFLHRCIHSSVVLIDTRVWP